MGGRKVESIKQNPLVKKVGFNRIVLCIVLLLTAPDVRSVLYPDRRLFLRYAPYLKCLELRILPGIFIAGSYIRNRNGRN